MQPIPASDPIIPIISEPNDEEKSQGAKTPPAQSTIFTLVYAAENTVPYPNSQQAEKERDHHLSKQSGKQHIDDSDDQIKHQLEENIKIVTFSNCNMLAGTTNADLDERSQAAKTSKVRG